MLTHQSLIHAMQRAALQSSTKRNLQRFVPRENDATNSLLSIYKEMTRSAEIQEDRHQLRAISELDRLRQELKTYVPPSLSTSSTQKVESETTPHWWQSFASSVAQQIQSVVPINLKDTYVPKGVYLHGGVGCGKTFVMNLFFEHLPNADDRQIVHFHKFMLRVHQQMHEAKRNQTAAVTGKRDDVLAHVVEKILEQGRIICFDEFQVTDVADAMILQRLFTSLIQRGAVLVATSNRPPQDLYLNGVQRDRFLPFIALLESKLTVISMWDSHTDYRLVNSKAKGVYFIGDEMKQDFDDMFHELTKDYGVAATNLSTQGRLVPIPRSCLAKGVARFAFEDLCAKALGAADYLVIGQTFHTVFVERVPSMTRDQVNWVRRFIIFVDSMYECHVKLIIHAKTEPDGIFQVNLEDTACDEVFAFDRTRSRLEEMRSQQYLQKRWAGKSATSGVTSSQLLVEPSLSENMPQF